MQITDHKRRALAGLKAGEGNPLCAAPPETTGDDTADVDIIYETQSYYHIPSIALYAGSHNVSDLTKDKSSAASATRASSVNDAGDLSSIFNYPHLGQLFEGDLSHPLDEMRARFARTSQELERIVRRGSKDEADSAERALRAYRVAAELLSELEQRRKGKR
jgi:hypothetical protein